MTAPPPPEFVLHLVFDTGHQTEIPVTLYEPMVVNGKIVDARIRQDSAHVGDVIVHYVDWSRVIFVGVSSHAQEFQK